MTKEADLNKEEIQKKQSQSQDGQWDEPKTYSEEDYKNAQSFGTKARQDLISMTEKLVKANPKELENIDDTKLQQKVIENLYGANSLEELKIISPEIFEEKSWSDEEDADELTKLQRKVQLMEYKNNQWALKGAIENIKITNKDLVDTIPDFEQKMEDEMKLFSSDISIKDKADRALKLIAWANSASADAYLALQGKTEIKSKADEKTKSSDEELYESPLAQAFKNRNAY